MNVLTDSKANEEIATIDFQIQNMVRQSQEASDRSSEWQQIRREIDGRIGELNRNKKRIETGSIYAEKMKAYPFERMTKSVYELNKWIIGFEHKRFLSNDDYEHFLYLVKQSKLWMHRYIQDRNS